MHLFSLEKRRKASKQEMRQSREPFPAPYWIEPFPRFKKYYSNPIFQKNLLRNTVELNVDYNRQVMFGMVTILIGGLIPSLIVFIIFFLALLLFIAFLKFFQLTVPSTIEGIRNVIDRDRHDPLLAAPIPDPAIYFGILFGRFMRGSELIGLIFAYLGGLLFFPGVVLVTFVVVAPFWLDGPDMFIRTFNVVSMFLLVLVAMFSVFPTLNLSAGMYALKLDNINASAAAIFHTALVLIAPVFLVLVVDSVLLGHELGENTISMGITIPAILLQVMLIYLTARLGLRVFRGERRAGAYHGI